MVIFHMLWTWMQVPVYMAGQYAGAFLAALVLWGEYAQAINMVSILTSMALYYKDFIASQVTFFNCIVHCCQLKTQK